MTTANGRASGDAIRGQRRRLEAGVRFGLPAALAPTAMAMAAILLAAADARASATFPPQVDSTLMVHIETIVPPDGCLLCHQTEIGGLGTNNAFGTMMKNAGAVGAEPATVAPALAKLMETNPRAIMDLTSGMNPNDDPSALSNDPIPQHGCGTIAGTPAASDCAGMTALLLALLARRHRRQRHRGAGRTRIS